MRPPRAAVPTPVVPGYQIVAELGRGGMGVVYKAWHLRLHRLVAIKMVAGGPSAAGDGLARLRTEAEALARLQHPHIVQIFEVGEHDGRPYLVMEYVDGGTLSRKLAAAPLPADGAAALLETLARAVHEAHRVGVLHRDLTPANILLEGTRGEGRETSADPALAPHSSPLAPKVTDFGLAKLVVGGGETLTQSGAVMGTPSYMAPEQAAGARAEVGPASDVYSLGAILYECLTGRPPFRAGTPLETVRQVIEAEPLTPSRLRAGLPRDLETVCLKCLRKEPRRRYASALALALAEDLRRFRAGEPVLARPVTRSERLWRWARRNPLVAGLSALALLLLVLLAGGASVSALLPGKEARRSAAAERDARDKLWRSYVEQARATRLSGRAGQRFDSLRVLAEAVRVARGLGVGDEDLREVRDQAIACLAVADLRPALDGEAPADAAAGAPDLGLRAAVEPSGAVVVRRVPGGAEVVRLPGSPGRAGAIPSVKQMAVHPRRRWLALRTFPPSTVRVVDLDRRREIWSKTLNGPVQAWGLAWSPAGDLLAGAGADRNTYLWEAETGEQRAVVPAVGAGLAFCHQAPLLLACDWAGQMSLWEPFTGRRLVRSPGGSADFRVTTDDHWVACAGGAVFELATGRECRRVDTRGMDFGRLSFGAGGRLLAAASEDGVTLWDVGTGNRAARLPVGAGDTALFEPADGSLWTYSAAGLWAWPVGADPHAAGGRRVGPPRRVGSFAVARPHDWLALGGRFVAVTEHDRDRAVFVDRAGPSGEPRPVSHARVRSVALSADGRWAATGSVGARGVRVWETATGRCVAELDLAEADVAFSPDGRWLVTGTAEEYSAWETATWARRYTVRRGGRGDEAGIGPAAFSPDGRLLALLCPDRLRLVAPETGAAVATLEGPVPAGDRVAFGGDGRFLAVGGADGGGIYLWDLAAVRRGLASLGLDVESLPAVQDGGSAEGNLSVRVEFGALDRTGR